MAVMVVEEVDGLAAMVEAEAEAEAEMAEVEEAEGVADEEEVK